MTQWYYNIIGSNPGVTTGPIFANNQAADKFQIFEVSDPNRIAIANKQVSETGNQGPMFGPFNSLADAQTFRKAHPPMTPLQFADGSRPNIPVITPVINAVTGVTSDIQNVAGGTVSLLAALVNPHTWLRVAEVLLGLVLMAIGIAKMTNAVPVATLVASKVGKVVKI